MTPGAEILPDDIDALRAALLAERAARRERSAEKRDEAMGAHVPAGSAPTHGPAEDDEVALARERYG